jgi:hypothetical protein
MISYEYFLFAIVAIKVMVCHYIKYNNLVSDENLLTFYRR